MGIAADCAFVNGRVYTLTGENAMVSAFAVYDGKIAAAGSNDEILRTCPKEIIDLGGRTVLPGFIETHCHMADFTEDRAKVNLEKARSLQDVVDLLKQRLCQTPDGGWITGEKLNLFLLDEKRLPDRFDLDRVSEDIPVFVGSVCKHNFVVNSKALALAGIDGRFLGAPEEKFLEFDASGKPTGRLKEHGMLKYINAVKPQLFSDAGAIARHLESSLSDFSSKGYTTVHSFNGFSASPLELPKAYRLLEEQGKLPVRVIINNEPGANRPEHIYSGFGTEKIKYGAAKFFADGSLMQWSAYLREDYSDKSGCRGMLVKSEELLEQGIKNAYESGNDIAVHAIGDGAVDAVINIAQRIKKPENPQVFRLIHATLTVPDQWEKIAELGIIIDAQPTFINLTGALGAQRLGSDRVKRLLTFNSWLKAGIVVTGGDDAPICDHNPFVGIRYAVLREPEPGARPVCPAERVSVYEAVKMYTVNAAACSRESHIKGSLEKGKYADFIIIDRDIFNIEPEQISDVNVSASYLGGKKVYAAD